MAGARTGSRADGQREVGRLRATGGSKLRIAGLRVSGDYRAEKLGAKIRDAQLELIPYMLVVGPRDAQQGTVSLRDRIEGDLGALPIDQTLQRLQDEIQSRTVRQTFSGSAGLGDRGAANRLSVSELRIGWPGGSAVRASRVRCQPRRPKLAVPQHEAGRAGLGVVNAVAARSDG